jgi:hypothetical protein
MAAVGELEPQLGCGSPEPGGEFVDVGAVPSPVE